MRLPDGHFRMGQYRDEDHRDDAPLFTGPQKPNMKNKSYEKMITFPILLFYRLDLDFVRRCQQFLVL